MMPTDGEHKEKSDCQQNQNNKPFTTTSGLGGSFGFGSFGQGSKVTQTGTTTEQEQQSQSTPFAAFNNDNTTPAKRASIDESWVNVDWNEVARKSNADSSPSTIEHPMASSIHPPTETNSFGYGGYGTTTATTTTAVPTMTSSTFTKPTESSKANGFSSSSMATETGMNNNSRFGFGNDNNNSLDTDKQQQDCSVEKSLTSNKSAFLFDGPTINTIKHEELPKSTMIESRSEILKPIITTAPTTPARESATIPPTISSTQATPLVQHHKFDLPSFKATPTKEENSKSVKVKEESKMNSTAATPRSTTTTTQQVKESKESKEPSTIATPAKSEKPTTASGASTVKSTPRPKSTPTTPRSSGRTRKSVDRLSPAVMEFGHESKAIEIPTGKGTKFADISHVSKELSKHKADYQPMITLHRVLFGRPGEANKRKASLRQFHGFGSDEDMEKASEKLSHHAVEELRDICVFLNLERSGEKKALAVRIANFLLNPCDLGESKPSPRKASQKRGKSSPSSAKKSKQAKSSEKVANNKKEEQEEAEEDEENSPESASDDDAKLVSDLDN